MGNFSRVPKKLAGNLRVLDDIYPNLRIDLVLVQGKFGSQLIEKAVPSFGSAQELRVHRYARR